MVQNTCYPPKDKSSNYEHVQLGQAFRDLDLSLECSMESQHSKQRGIYLKKKKRLGDSSMISEESKQAGMMAFDWETM